MDKNRVKRELRKLGVAILGNYVKRSDLKKVIASNRDPAVWVGTYGKYNSGEKKGRWFSLEDFKDKDDFLEAAYNFHSDEESPELMFADYQDFPSRYYYESSLPDELWDWLKLNDEDKDILEAYIEEYNDPKATIDDAKDAFRGIYKSKEAWAEEFLEEIEGLSEENARFYLEIYPGDKDIIADEEAERYLEDKDDDEILKEADMLDEYEATEDEDKKEVILEKAKDEIRDKKTNEIKKELDDPVSYFVDELGWNLEFLMKKPWITIDYEKFARDAEINGTVSFYHKNGEYWVFSNY